MKRLITAAIIASGLSSVANAAVIGTYSNSQPGGAIDYAFDDLSGNADLTISGGSIKSGSTPGTAVAPAGSIGSYFSVDPRTSPGIITFATGVSSLSFLWGSPDVYNSLLVTLTDATSTPIAPFRITGFNSDTRWLTIAADPGQVIKSLTLASTGFAFEIDSLRYTVAATPAIPEPATWAMMIAGFGLAGAALRRSVTRVSFV